MKVPFLDMKARHAPLREEFMRAIGEVIDSGVFAGGPIVEKFERDFAANCGTRFAVGVGSGTEALWLAMIAMGIGPGDEVITTPMTFAATVEAICLTGAKPVFVDIHDRTYTLDPAGLEDALTARTKAILPVHLFGQTADMDPILGIAGKRGIRVIEDAAQSHGAEYHGRRSGSLGDAGCFSFYPSKNLGAFGDGGAVVTDDEKIAQKIRVLRDHGQSEKNRHAIVGWNSRLDAIQAAVLSVKIRHLARENQTRREIARAYDQAFADMVDVLTPHARAGGNHVYHIYAIRVRNREALLRNFDAKGIGYSVHYPVPVHLQPAYRILGHSAGDFPVAERCANEFVSLPLFPEMTAEQFSFVADTVRETFSVCISA